MAVPGYVAALEGHVVLDRVGLRQRGGGLRRRAAADELEKITEQLSGRIAVLEFDADATAELTKEMYETTQIWLNRLSDRPKGARMK